MAVWRSTGLVAMLAVSLSGCSGSDKAAADRPAPKPAMLLEKTATKAKPTLNPGRVSTKSGDILILENDGSVSEVALDSAGGRDAFDVTEADLAALEQNLGLDLSAVSSSGAGAPPAPSRQRAQELALAAFAKRTQPALPKFPVGFKVDANDFVGVSVVRVDGDRRGDLIKVDARLRRGVDADVAFAYATCALAGWADKNKTDFARHIMSIQKRQNGQLQIDAIYTLSKSRPMGLRVMETNPTLRDCRDRGIPASQEGTVANG